MDNTAPLVRDSKRKSKATIEYENRLKENPKAKNTKEALTDKDNIFNFDPLMERTHKKMHKGEFPSKFYTIDANRHSRHIDLKQPSKNYINNVRKDHVKDFFENKDNNNKETIMNKTFYCSYRPAKTEVNELFESSKKYVPVKYKEPTTVPGKVDFNILTEVAKSNVPNIRKNGKKNRGRDFCLKENNNSKKTNIK